MALDSHEPLKMAAKPKKEFSIPNSPKPSGPIFTARYLFLMMAINIRANSLELIKDALLIKFFKIIF